MVASGPVGDPAMPASITPPDKWQTCVFLIPQPEAVPSIGQPISTNRGERAPGAPRKQDERRTSRLARLIPLGHEARIDVSITDEYPLAQAFVVISAVPLGAPG